MTNLVKWNTPESYTSALSTGLNTLTDGSSATSSALTNGTDLYPLMDLSVLLASFTPGTGGYLELHILPLSDDGSHYADITISTCAGTLSVISGASAKYETLHGIQIPPRDFKIALVSHLGASMASSGNTVKYSRYYINNNG